MIERSVLPTLSLLLLCVWSYLARARNFSQPTSRDLAQTVQTSLRPVRILSTASNIPTLEIASKTRQYSSHSARTRSYNARAQSRLGPQTLHMAPKRSGAFPVSSSSMTMVLESFLQAHLGKLGARCSLRRWP
ncbi:hypothetical protein BC830DRAFT_1113486 [Chytriomyces sp. MP71]|nr:hypothetical protein BC830DRAFT_1113486 [Chytriomyces sp. MP71]